MTVLIAAFFAGLGCCLVAELLHEPRAPGWRVTSALAALSLTIAVGTIVTGAFG